MMLLGPVYLITDCILSSADPVLWRRHHICCDGEEGWPNETSPCSPLPRDVRTGITRHGTVNLLSYIMYVRVRGDIHISYRICNEKCYRQILIYMFCTTYINTRAMLLIWRSAMLLMQRYILLMQRTVSVNIQQRYYFCSGFIYLFIYLFI